MKKLAAILFFTTYLFSTTELSQLLKFPAFVSHFIEHRQEKNDLTLWEFFCMHYTGDVKKDADYEKDMKLPFKTHDNCAAQINLAAPPSAFAIGHHKVTHIEERKRYFPHDVFVNSSFFANIWQPPKSC